MSIIDRDSELVTKADLAAAVDKTAEFRRNVQTELLQVIHGYVEASEARLKRPLSATTLYAHKETADFSARLVALESRVCEVERKC